VLIDKHLDFRFGEMGGKSWAHVEAYWISAVTPHIVAMRPTASATVLFEFIQTAAYATRRSIEAANAKGMA